MRDPAISGVVGRLSILAGVTCFVISPDEKYRVVRSGGNRETHENADGESRNFNEADVPEESDDSPHQRQFDPDRGQYEQDGRNRSVHEQQHDRDHHHGRYGDLDNLVVAALDQVRGERRRTGYVDLDPRRRGYLLHDMPNSLNRFDR